MGYSHNPAMVRVDFFKESGKWYATEEVEWLDFHAPIIQDAFKASLINKLRRPDGSIRYRGMWAVCLEPYHSHSFPLMQKVED